MTAECGLPINISWISTQKGEVLFKQKHSFDRTDVNKLCKSILRLGMGTFLSFQGIAVGFLLLHHHSRRNGSKNEFCDGAGSLYHAVSFRGLPMTERKWIDLKGPFWYCAACRTVRFLFSSFKSSSGMICCSAYTLTHLIPAVLAHLEGRKNSLLVSRALMQTACHSVISTYTVHILFIAVEKSKNNIFFSLMDCRKLSLTIV